MAWASQMRIRTCPEIPIFKRVRNRWDLAFEAGALSASTSQNWLTKRLERFLFWITSRQLLQRSAMQQRLKARVGVQACPR